MPSDIMPFFKRFLEKYPAQPPRRNPGHQDEVILLGRKDGVLEFSLPPMSFTHAGHPSGEGLEVKNTYLWVIMSDKIPYILEKGEASLRLHGREVKHTNLTGGGPAHCGGEIWFSTDGFFFFSGRSGRYGPESEEKLKDTAESLQASGHSFICLGWDEEVGRPSIILREEFAWDYRK